MNGCCKISMRPKNNILALTKKSLGLTFIVALAHVSLPAQLLNYCDVEEQVRASCVDKENNLGSPCAHSPEWHFKRIKNNNHNVQLFDVYTHIFKDKSVLPVELNIS